MPASDCPANAVCVWQQPDFQGDRDDFTLGGCLEIHFRSIVNNAPNFTAAVFSLGGCRGERLRFMAPGTQDSNLEGNSVNMQRIS
jgi:Peptidase inhibitor family I36